MLLALDVGNTNTVFALFEGNSLRQSWRCKTETARSADEYAVFLKQLFDLVGVDWGDVKGVIIGSVVPDTHFNLEQLCRKYMNQEPFFVSAKNAGIRVDIDQPGEAGADRLANAAAVVSKHKERLPVVVIDFGTATTFDIINKAGVYCGGVIAPGVRLSMSALTQRAAKLPQITIEQPESAIGRNTRGAMQSGMYWGYIGLIEKILEQVQGELEGKPYVIATGGLAPLYAQNTDVIDLIDHNLTLYGLLEIYNKHKDKKT